MILGGFRQQFKRSNTCWTFFEGFGQQFKRRNTCPSAESLGSFRGLMLAGPSVEAVKRIILAGPSGFSSSLRCRTLAGPFVEGSDSSLRRQRGLIPAGPLVEDLGSLMRASCLQMEGTAPPQPLPLVLTGQTCVEACESCPKQNLGFLPDGKMGVRSTLCLASNQGATWITWPHYPRRSSVWPKFRARHGVLGP